MATRREFLQTAGMAAGAAPVARSPFAPRTKPRKISDNLFVFEDTCNVYVVKDGTAAVLIDFGSGAILEHLPALGVSGMKTVMHTHHHRDQCQGDDKAVARHIPVAVPAHERHLFADAENFWRNRRVFHLYYVRNDFNTLTRNIPVAFTLDDYTRPRFGNLTFFVQPAPGHTLGSIALMATVDGRRVAFTGDLMYAAGKIPTLYDTQINYGGSEGVDFAIYSLARLREQEPELLCPSHGEPIPDPDAAMAETIRRLSDYYRFQMGQPTEEQRGFAVSPHLVAHHQTTSSFYAIVSDSGKAMLIDYGSGSWNFFSQMERATATTDRIRFLEHSIPELQNKFGVKSIGVAMPSHMHDDHVNGFPHLMNKYGTQVWCYENMRDIFEHPRGHNLGCILAEPFKVSRTFRHGERFKWEEFDFEVTHSPGHTEYQMALYATLDGRRVAFTGDAFFEQPGQAAMRHNLIFRNHVENDSHLKSIRNLIEHEPELICPGHGKPYAVTRAMMDATDAKLRKQQQFFFDLLPEGEAGFGLDPSWVSIYPYQMLAAPGDRQTLEIRVRNYKPSPMRVEAALVAPAEWSVEPAVVKVSVPPRASASATVAVTVPRGWEPPAPRFAIAADVMADGKYLGQITEAVVDIRTVGGYRRG